MKKSGLLLATICTSAIMGISAFAGQWQSDANGWWWQNDDGSYPVSSWQWLDGNNDGVAECYYFNESGYMLADTTTPDGHTVDKNGAWVVDGAIQTQVSYAQQQASSNSYVGTYYFHSVNAMEGSYEAPDTNLKIYITENNGQLYINGDFYGDYLYVYQELTGGPKPLVKNEELSAMAGANYYTVHYEEGGYDREIILGDGYLEVVSPNEYDRFIKE